MTGMLAFCRCGHLRDEHIAGGGCIHLNRASKLGPECICMCTLYEPDERLRNSEDFIAKVLEKVLAKEAIPIEPVEREEALQVLRISLWKTSAKYDNRSHVRFRVYAYLELYNDAIDHIRSDRGRHGQHRVYDGRVLDGVADGVGERDRLDEPSGPDPTSDPDGWLTDGAGLVDLGYRGRNWSEGSRRRGEDRPDSERAA